MERVRAPADQILRRLSRRGRRKERRGEEGHAGVFEAGLLIAVRGPNDDFQERGAFAGVDDAADDVAARDFIPDEAAVFAGTQGESFGGDVNEQAAVFLPPAEGFALGKASPDTSEAPTTFSPHLNPLTGHNDRPVDP